MVLEWIRGKAIDLDVETANEPSGVSTYVLRRPTSVSG